MTSALFLLTFFLFLRTACGSISYDDSGEVCLVAIGKGLMHPPGYPLLTLLTSVASRIPVGSIAFRVNLLSASLSAGVICLLFRFWLTVRAGRPLTGWIGSLVVGLAFGLWDQAGVAKGSVYSLNALIILGVLISLGNWNEERKGSVIASGAGVGMGLAHHWMSMPGLLPGLLLACVGFRVRQRARVFILAAMAALVGVSLYVCIPLLSKGKPFMNWGRPDVVTRFCSVVLREQYLGPPVDPEPLRERIGSVANSIGRAGPWWLIGALAIFGVLRMWARQRLITAALVLYVGVLYGSLLAYGPMRSGAPWYLQIFSIPGALVIGWLAILGVEAAAERLNQRRAGIIAALICAVAGLLIVPARWRTCDRSREYLAYDLALNFAAVARGPSLLFGSSDVVVFSNWHAWHVEARHRELVAVPTPLLPQPWVAVSFADAQRNLAAPYPAPWAGAESVPSLLKAWCEVNESKFDLYTLRSKASAAAFQESQMKGEGLMHRIVLEPGGRSKTGTRRAWRGMKRMRLRGVAGSEIRRERRKFASLQPIYFSGLLSLGNRLTERDPDEAKRALNVAGSLAASPSDRALVAMARGNVSLSRGETLIAHAHYREALGADSLLKEAWYNLGLVCLALGRRQEALDAARRLREIEPESEEARELARLMRDLERKRPSAR